MIWLSYLLSRVLLVSILRFASVLYHTQYDKEVTTLKDAPLYHCSFLFSGHFNLGCGVEVRTVLHYFLYLFPTL